VRYQKRSLAQAVEAVVQGKLRDLGGEGGVIAIDPQGRIVMDFNSEGMFRGARSANGLNEIAIYRKP
jgi:beta-aspartyl-peptidase (threonine type)